MGEATYYAKIFFDTPQNAQKAFPKIQKFFEQGIKAHDFWQNWRETENKSDDDFWSQLDRKFPEIGNYMRTVYRKNYYTGELDIAYCAPMYGCALGNDCDNGPAGYLDFGDESDLDRLAVINNSIWYSAYVWHFAEWDPMMNFIRKRYGALRTEWLSDEYINPFDLLN